MNLRAIDDLQFLYESDETGWLEAMAELIREGRFEELDYSNLKEYLSDMARRDRREVKSRLTVLLGHLLKWIHQPKKRTKSWRHTVTVQVQELGDLISGGVLRAYAEEILGEAYVNALERAAAETGLSADSFPSECPFSIDQLLSTHVLKD